jgi:diaminopimelate epimerase
VKFEKWQALGNDYLIVEAQELPFELTPRRIRRLCARHFGVGADGVLLLSRSEDPRFVADLRIYNPDGSEAELSGNGAREAVLYLRRHGWTEEDVFSIHTPAGAITPQITGPYTCRVDMGRASLTSKDFPGGAPDGRGELSVYSGELSTLHFQHVSIGNPQCAIHVATMDSLLYFAEPEVLGPQIEAHESFPNRTNVSWYTEIDADPAHAGPSGRIRARIFERGVGETLSSGTGAAGAAIAYVLEAGGPPQSVTVVLDGGELQVEVGEDLQVHLTGWAMPVFAGELSDAFFGNPQALSTTTERQPPTEEPDEAE